MSFLNRWKGSSNLIGLDIGSHTLKAVSLKKKKSPFEIETLSYVGLPRGAVVDGDIMDAYTLEESIKELFSKEKLPQKEVAYAVSGTAVIAKRITLPKLAEEEIEDQLPIIASQYIPFSIDETNIDYQILPAEPGQAQKMHLLIVAVKKKFLEIFQNVIEGADLKTVAVEPVSTTLANLFTLLYPEEKNVLLIHAGAYSAEAIILHNGGFAFHRHLPFGGNHITDALRETLKISLTEAESLKVSCFKEKHLPQETMEIIERSCDQLCHEVQTAIHHALTQFPELAIEKIYLSGGTAKIVPLAAWISQKTAIETQPLKLEKLTFNKQNLNPKYVEELEPLVPVAVGLAAR